MHRWLLVLSLAAVASPAFADTPLGHRKPGLWEVQYGVTGSGEEARKAQAMRERIAQMPPEKRAQMEEYMKRSGMGISAGPDGQLMTTLRVCLTPQDIAQEGRSFMQGVTKNSDCTPQLDQRSASEVHVHAVCHGADTTFAEVDARIYDIASDHYAVDMSAKSPTRGDVHMVQKARWLGSDCQKAP